MRRRTSPGSRRLFRISAVLATTVVVGGFTAAASIASPALLATPLAQAHRALTAPAHHGLTVRTRGITAHGQLIHPFKTNQSSNWSGYNQGAVEQGGKLFHSITGYWTVPAATQHTKGQAEYSADWIGIGGGCVDASCTVTDPTLIQTGTEQDVSASGASSYSAWYELIPAPSLTVTTVHPHPGNRMFASISTVASNADVWTITIKDVTTGQSYTTTVPYTSTQDTAEWIEETPLIIGTNGGFAALPNLTSPKFDRATTNGAPAKLKSSEEMQLVNSSGKVIADPSAPDPDSDGFNVCAWMTSCAAPTTS
jgi:hypothetical protein